MNLSGKFSELSSLIRPVDNDIIRYQSSTEACKPFGITLEDGKKVSKDNEKLLESVERTYGKLDAVQKVALAIDEDLKEYGIEANVARSSVRDRKKQLDEIKDIYEKRNENVVSQVVELEEFLDDSEKLKSWVAEIQGEVDKVYAIDEEPDNVEKQLNEIEVK